MYVTTLCVCIAYTLSAGAALRSTRSTHESDGEANSETTHTCPHMELLQGRDGRDGREEREESRDSRAHMAPTVFLAPRAPQDHKGCLDPPMVYQEILDHRDPRENLDPPVPRGRVVVGWSTHGGERQPVLPPLELHWCTVEGLEVAGITVLVVEPTTCAYLMTHSIFLLISQDPFLQFMGQSMTIGLVVISIIMHPVLCAMYPHAHPTS